MAAQSGIDFPVAFTCIRPAPSVLNVRLNPLGFDPVGRTDHIIEFNDLVRTFVGIAYAVSWILPGS